jgi:hypothetical protein
MRREKAVVILGISLDNMEHFPELWYITRTNPAYERFYDKITYSC